MDSKLSDLSESQRQDLEKLLLEFEHLFPDVPTRTDQIYHEVDVGNADLIKQKYLKEEIKYLPSSSLMLQEYVLEISHIKGKDNVTADCLSRV